MFLMRSFSSRWILEVVHTRCGECFFQQLNFGSSLTLVDLDLCGVCPILLCSDNSFRYVPSSSFNMPLHQRGIFLFTFRLGCQVHLPYSHEYKLTGTEVTAEVVLNAYFKARRHMQ